MAVRALRGAITVDADDPSEIRQRTIDMLQALFDRNSLEIDDVIDPAETRNRVIGAFRSAPPPEPRTGRKRPGIDPW